MPNLNDPRYIIIHHGAGQLNFEQVNEYHKGKWGFKSSLHTISAMDILFPIPAEFIKVGADTKNK